jgi:hypothetical protein
MLTLVPENILVIFFSGNERLLLAETNSNKLTFVFRKAGDNEK